MSKIKLLSLVLILLIFSCKKEEQLIPINNNVSDTTAGLLIADFSYEVIVKANQPDVYTFKNKSKNAISFKWYFGNFDSSTVLDPSITFPTQDFYIVKLVVSDGKKSKMKAFRIEVKDLNPENPTNDKLDFEVSVNCDSTNLYKCTNLSYGYTDFKWTFNDGTESTEINPEHLFTNTSTTQKIVTLTAKNLNGNIESITRSFYNGYQTFKIEHCAVILVNQNPIRYRFYEYKSSYEDLFIDYITYFDGIKTDTIQYKDASTELELSNYQGINTFKFHVKNPYNSNNLTVYKILKTPSINNVINQISKLNGLADFNERYLLEEITGSAPRKTVYNDTTLNITLNNGVNVSIIDNTLNHSFSGYPTFWNYNTLNDSNIVSFMDYNMNSTNPFVNSSKEIKFKTTSNDIIARYYYYQSGKVSLKTELNYNGKLR